MIKPVLFGVFGLLALFSLAAALFLAANWAPELSLAQLKARWAPPPSVFLDVEGMSVHLRDEGPRTDPAPIVLVHGMGSSLHAWEGWAQALKAEHRVVRFDLPGFGLTGPSPDGIYTIERDVSAVIAVLDKLGIERCVLGGVSLGGTVAWRTALAHPSRVEKLILVDSSGYPTVPVSQPIGYRLPGLPGAGTRWLAENILPRFLVVQGIRNVFGDPDKVTDEMVDRSVELTRLKGNRRAIVERFRQDDDGDFYLRLPELKLPTLIVWGAKDRLVPLEYAYRFHRDIAGSKLVIFDGLGHAPEEEDPARSVRAVEDFLKQRSAS